MLNMLSKHTKHNLILIVLTVFFGGSALTLACVGIGVSDWQVTQVNVTSGIVYLTNTANYFYSCYKNAFGDVLGCVERSKNSTIGQYYVINATGSESDWILHLNAAAGFSIIGIIFIFFGVLATISTLCIETKMWLTLFGPLLLFLACLFMLAGLAEGARVLLYNGFGANLFETAHLLTIFSFMLSSILCGRTFHVTEETKLTSRM